MIKSFVPELEATISDLTSNTSSASSIEVDAISDDFASKSSKVGKGFTTETARELIRECSVLVQRVLDWVEGKDVQDADSEVNKCKVRTGSLILTGI